MISQSTKGAGSGGREKTAKHGGWGTHRQLKRHRKPKNIGSPAPPNTQNTPTSQVERGRSNPPTNPHPAARTKHPPPSQISPRRSSPRWETWTGPAAPSPPSQARGRGPRSRARSAGCTSGRPPARRSSARPALWRATPPAERRRPSHCSSAEWADGALALEPIRCNKQP